MRIIFLLNLFRLNGRLELETFRVWVKFRQSLSWNLWATQSGSVIGVKCYHISEYLNVVGVCVSDLVTVSACQRVSLKNFIKFVRNQASWRIVTQVTSLTIKNVTYHWSSIKNSLFNCKKCLTQNPNLKKTPPTPQLSSFPEKFIHIARNRHRNSSRLETWEYLQAMNVYRAAGSGA